MLNRLFASSCLAALVLAGCSTPALTDTSPQDAGQTDAAVDARNDIPAVDVSDATAVDASDATATDTAPLDVPAPSDVSDVPATIDAVTDTALGPCALTNGGTCARGQTCPAGDGCNTCSCPVSGGSAVCTTRVCRDAAADVPVPTDAASGTCRVAADCRLYSSYCSTDPCVCFALPVGSRDPVCGGGTVTCFIDPCSRHTVDCVGGACTVL